MMRFLSILLIVCSLTSCIVQAPKYSNVEDVLILKVGMTKEDVSATLGIPPYDIKSYTDSTSELIYKYRTTDRRTLSFLLEETNGHRVKGKWVDLFITYDKNNKATEIKSCSYCGETKVKEQRINYNAVIQALSVVAPGLLVYFGLRAQ
jgi:outer membrane protein assembly factor BamE (lipoprotein component of BamABCDE complex)